MGPSVVNDVFAAPRGGLGGDASCGSWERSTRLLGHGMPWEESSGSEGEEWMKGGPEGSSKCLLDLRRKLNMVGDEYGAGNRYQSPQGATWEAKGAGW